MARKATKGMQKHPEGGMITPSPEERADVRKRREARGWKQEDLAARVPCSTATISNFETGATSGRSKQVNRSVYAAILRVLRMAEAGQPSSPVMDDAFRRIVKGVIELDETSILAVANLVDSLKKPRQSGPT